MSGKIIRKCETCGSGFEVWPSQPKKFCSHKCSCRRVSPRERFARHVNESGPVPTHRPELGPCAVWTGSRDRLGYGSFGLSHLPNSAELAHRAAWFLEFGTMPVDCLLHACDNPSCVRISHLFEGSRADNSADMWSKNRQSRPPIMIGSGHARAKLHESEVPGVRVAHANGETIASIARRLSVTETAIRLIVQRKTWRHVA